VAHTPGPWRAEPIRRRGLVVGFQIIAGPDGNPIAEVRWPGPNLPDNARLIAAAPQLLEALEALLEATSLPAAERQQLLRRARRAVRAARGDDAPEWGG
jgi:hypothetical protein